MGKFVIKYHFDREHMLRQVVEAESMFDARAKMTSSMRGDDHFRVFEIRSEDNLYMIPLAAIRYIQIVEAEREAAPAKQWEFEGEVTGPVKQWNFDEELVMPPAKSTPPKPAPKTPPTTTVLTSKPPKRKLL